jgi:hypothetical protein
MRVIVPLTLTLTSSTATASALDEWSDATAYVPGNQVKVTTSVPHTEWESIQGGTNKPPADEPDYWVQLGVTNPYRMLDNTVNTTSTATETFTAVLTTPRRITHLGLFGLDGVRSVTVSVIYDGETEWTDTATLGRLDESATWWEYFFNAADYGETLVMAVPGWHNSDQTISVTFTGDTSATVSVGHLVLGVGQELGMTVYSAEAGIQSFSRKEADAWGNYYLAPRANAKRIQARVIIPGGTVDRVYRAISGLDAVAAVYDFNNSEAPEAARDALTVFGFFRDFRLLMEGYNQDYAEFEVEGLI